jgi:ABC-type transport system involved in cytochrome c biogenesis permease subunit
MPTAFRHPEELKGHRLELAYGAGSLLFIAALTTFFILDYSSLVQGWLDRIFPHLIASTLGVLLVLVILGVSVAAVVGDLRSARAATPRGG